MTDRLGEDHRRYPNCYSCKLYYDDSVTRKGQGHKCCTGVASDAALDHMVMHLELASLASHHDDQ